MRRPGEGRERGAAGPPEEAPFSLEAILRRPEQLAKGAPCQAGCVAGGDVRGWIALVAQREKLGLGLEEACERAWRGIVEVNPFPAVTGRICPHPCEASCNREAKDGAVAVSAMERYLGDWALERGLPLPRPDEGPWPESVAVAGAGPAGLSFAYQMARRGYRVVVHERETRPGGMLLRAIPEYRLPEHVLTAEIDRLLELDIDLRLGSRVGVDVPLDRLREEHDVLFLGIGAQSARRLGVPGDEGPGCWTGIDFLRRFNEGAPPDPARHVAVVGGGNTAIDAARAARRCGSRVTLVYRRTREEMPAIAAEVDEALAEGVELEELLAPLAVLREGDAVRALRVRRMRLGTPDASGRRRPEPVPGSERDLPVDAVIAAVSQEPDWSGLDGLRPPDGWVSADGGGGFADGLWAGGDARGLGIAGLAIGQGRSAAEAVHARLRGRPAPEAVPSMPDAAKAPRPHLQLYEERPRARALRLSPEEGLARPDEELVSTLDREAFLREASRCLSCGSCFGCQHCWMYCNAGAFARVAEPAAGAYFVLDAGRCEGCGKCIEVCPCGFLSLR